MNNEQKQRMTHELGQWNAAMKSSCSVSDLLAISTRMAALLQELIDAPDPEQPNQSEQHLDMVNAPAPSVPVLIVECEPDYWSGGHYHEGTMPHIDPTAVWKLPIGTKLYTTPEQAAGVPDVALIDEGMKATHDAHSPFYVYKPHTPHGAVDVELDGLPWDYCFGRDSPYAARMLVVPAKQHLDMVKDAERVFIKKIAEQTPEKPDYWSECGQCSYNISEAQDLIDAAIAAEKGGA